MWLAVTWKGRGSDAQKLLVSQFNIILNFVLPTILGTQSLKESVSQKLERSLDEKENKRTGKDKVQFVTESKSGKLVIVEIP